MNLKFVLKQYVKMGVQNVFLPAVYRFYRKREVDPDCVVFADAHHRELPFSMRCFYEQVQKAGKKPVLLISDYGEDSFTESLRQMIRFMKAYANAGCVVLCDNFLPAASCKKRKETTVVQLWHACGALKKFGYDTPEDIPKYYRGNVLKNCDLVTVSSAWCAPHFASAMALPRERIVPTGVSRTDLYYQEAFLEDCRRRFAERYPQAAGKKVLLWAPTFRGNPSMPGICGEEAIDALAKRLGDGWLVIKSLHPHLLTEAEKKGKMPAEELLPAADLLVTDYSSILFDYLIFQRPIVRYAPDLEQYEKKRGFYMDYRALPGALVTEADGLYEAVLRETEQFDAEAARRVFEQYMGACDGGATGRILDRIYAGGTARKEK